MKRVLLPEWCSSPSGSFSVEKLKAILENDSHSVLITGETGTGKEVLADYVQYKTKPRKIVFQRINCTGLDRQLVACCIMKYRGTLRRLPANLDKVHDKVYTR